MPAEAGRLDPLHYRSRPGRVRSLIIALGLSLTIAAVEVAGGLKAGSLALLGDAAHMLTDVFAIGLALAAVYFARRPATARKSYGYYRLEVLCALVNGVLLSVIALFLCYEAVKRLREPPEISGGLMLVVALVGLIGNLIAAAVLHGGRANMAVRGAYLHVLGDTLSSIGVVAGGAIISITDRARIVDPLLSILIAGIILYNAVRLVRDTVNVLLEAIPPGIELLAVNQAMTSVEGVVDVHDLHIWSLTEGFEALSAHVTVETSALEDTDVVLKQLTGLLSEQFGIHHSTLQIESRAYRDTGVVHD